MFCFLHTFFLTISLRNNLFSKCDTLINIVKACQDFKIVTGMHFQVVRNKLTSVLSELGYSLVQEAVRVSIYDERGALWRLPKEWIGHLAADAGFMLDCEGMVRAVDMGTGRNISVTGLAPPRAK